MPSLAANRLTSAHRRDVALTGIAVRQAVGRAVAKAAPSDIDGWFASVLDQLVALVRGGFGQTRTLGAQYLQAHAAIEGTSVTPKPARFNRQRVVTSLRVTGPVEFKRHMALTGSADASLAAMRRTIIAAAERQALAGERGTVDETVRTSDEIVGWRRVVGGRGCGFCAMLASRGAVYKSAGTAGLGNQYHDNDQCSVEPLYEREDEPAEVRELQRQWARVTAGYSGEDAIRVWRRHWEAARVSTTTAAKQTPAVGAVLAPQTQPDGTGPARGERALVAAPNQSTTGEPRRLDEIMSDTNDAARTALTGNNTERAAAKARLEAIRAEVRQALEGEYAGLRVALTDISNDVGDSLNLEGEIWQGERRVGQFRRVLTRDQDGKLIARHSLLELERDVQGSGFAREFNRTLYDWYRRSGFDRVLVHANIDVGGYTWASQGFDFRDQKAFDNWAHSVRSRIESIRQGERPLRLTGLSDDEAAGALATFEQLVAEAKRRHVSAYEFSQVGRRPGQGRDDTWIGKYMMLGTRWFGAKPL